MLETEIPTFGICLGHQLLALACGCAGYQVGNQSLYPMHIRTVYVPTFESTTRSCGWPESGPVTVHSHEVPTTSSARRS